MHSPQTPLSVKGYQEILLRDAQGPHRAPLAKARNPRPWERILATVGELLILVGSKLLDRYQPALPNGSEVCSMATGEAGV